MSQLLISMRNVSAVVLLATIFLTRPLTAVGLPSLLNLAHLAYVPIAALFVAMTLNHEDRRIAGLVLALAGLNVLSATINQAGTFNILLSTLIYTEPFILFLALTGKGWTGKWRTFLIQGVEVLFVVHLLFIVFQAVALGYRDDQLQGIFLGLAGGAHISGALGIFAAVYASTFRRPKPSPSIRLGLWVLAGTMIVASDAKQNIIGLIIVLALQSLFSIRKPLLALPLIAGTGLVIYLFFKLLDYISLAYSPDLIQTGFELKLTVFSFLSDEMEGLGHWLFGLGPGHSVSRVAFVLPLYEWMHNLVDVTISPFTTIVRDFQQSNYMTASDTGSSLFSLFFSWSALLGDLGLVGVGLNIALWYELYRRSIRSNGSWFLVLFLFVMSAIYFYLGEPGFTAAIVWLLAIGAAQDKADASVDTKKGEPPNRRRRRPRDRRRLAVRPAPQAPLSDR